MKIMFYLNLYSGLKSSILDQKWDPMGVPTIYNLIERLDRDLHDSLSLRINDDCAIYSGTRILRI